MYRIESRGHKFLIYIGEKLVFSHTPEAPFAEAAKGHWEMLGDVARNVREGFVPLSRVNYDANRNLLRLFGGDYSVTFHISEHNGLLRLAPQRVSTGLNRFRLRLPAVPGGAVYGGGGQRSGKLNLRGEKIHLWVGEQSVHQPKAHPPSLRMKGVPSLLSECPMPVFITSGNIGYVFESYGRAAFDFTSQKHHGVSLWELPSAILIGSADTPLELLGLITKATGRQPAPPQWFLEGTLVEARGGSYKAAELLEKTLMSGAVISSVYIPDWTGGFDTPAGRRPFYDWAWNQETYPKLDDFIRQLSDKRVRTMAYINPHFSIEGRLYAEASNAGYLLLKPQGGAYISDMGGFMAGHLDLTNPDACFWFKEVIKNNVLALGFSGYFADGGEYLPGDAVTHSGENAVRLHNRWPVMWAALNREIVREAGRAVDSVVFSKYGWLGSGSQSMVVSTGAHHTSWHKKQGFPSALSSAIQLSHSGIGLNITECGGTVTLSKSLSRTPELYMRWMEYAAFSPAFLLFNGDSSGVSIENDDEILKFFARMSRIHAALGGYMKSLARGLANDGAPITRSLYLNFPDDKRFRDLTDAYMLGSELLVYPAMKKGIKALHVMFPEGQWRHLWSGKIYSEGSANISVPLGQPAVFYCPDGKHAGIFEELPMIVSK